MTTARDIIEIALRKIHVLGRGQSLQNDEAQDALTALNDMLASWSVEGGYVFTETTETFNLTSAASYTIGSGGDFDTDRPFEIVSAYVSDASTDYPLMLIDQKEYSRISNKTIAGVPDQLYFDNNYPLANIKLYPVPSAANTLTLNSYKPLTSFAGLSNTVNLPPGYNRALVFNLAVELAPDYSKEPTGTVLSVAEQSKSIIFTSNTRNDKFISSVDTALLQNYSDYNIYRGY